MITTVAGNGTEALSESAALLAPLARETSDAYNLLLGKYKDGLIPDTAICNGPQKLDRRMAFS